MPYKNKADNAASKVRSNKAARIRVLAHYSEGKMCCACCGENHLEFLALDHVAGGGSKHRKEVGSPMWYWLASRGYPEGFRVLCHNCNMARAFYGMCPHEGQTQGA